MEIGMLALAAGACRRYPFDSKKRGAAGIAPR